MVWERRLRRAVPRRKEDLLLIPHLSASRFNYYKYQWNVGQIGRSNKCPRPRAAGWCREGVGATSWGEVGWEKEVQRHPSIDCQVGGETPLLAALPPSGLTPARGSLARRSPPRRMHPRPCPLHLSALLSPAAQSIVWDDWYHCRSSLSRPTLMDWRLKCNLSDWNYSQGHCGFQLTDYFLCHRGKLNVTSFSLQWIPNLLLNVQLSINDLIQIPWKKKHELSIFILCTLHLRYFINYN